MLIRLGIFLAAVTGKLPY